MDPMPLTEDTARVQRTVNPTLEVHVFCRACWPGAERALCGAPLHGIQHTGCELITCIVCERVHTCPGCGGWR